ncbi:hypothetical protein GQR58_030616 [Nymphon striatum]|nr:hypothetical protein GQR58_030616 [Nymphon striatum]
MILSVSIIFRHLRWYRSRLSSNGSLHIVPTGCSLDQAREIPAAPQQAIVPPQKGPVSSWSPGEVAVVTIGFYPEAWAKLEQSDAAQDVSRAMQKAFGGLRSDEDIEARWAGRVALAGPGRSLRAFERRLRRWSRQSRQSLKFFSDFENLHELASRQPNSSLAALASDAGYSDQSHMGRAVRRATGFSPAQLNRLVETKEAFWCYQVTGGTVLARSGAERGNVIPKAAGAEKFH